MSTLEKNKWFHRNHQPKKHKIQLTYFLGIKISQFEVTFAIKINLQILKLLSLIKNIFLNVSKKLFILLLFEL